MNITLLPYELGDPQGIKQIFITSTIKCEYEQKYPCCICRSKYRSFVYTMHIMFAPKNICTVLGANKYRTKLRVYSPGQIQMICDIQIH